MKLYVWVSPYHVPYGSSLVFAVAENVREARKQASKGPMYSFGEYGQSRNPGVALGEPTRVLALPCAEWHEWQE